MFFIGVDITTDLSTALPQSFTPSPPSTDFCHGSFPQPLFSVIKFVWNIHQLLCTIKTSIHANKNLLFVDTNQNNA